MKKLTAKEILEIIEANYTEDNFAYNEWLEIREDNNIDVEPLEWNWNDKSKTYDDYEKAKEIKIKEIFDKLGLGQVEEVAQYGGEGKGDTWYSVKYFKDHDVYIRIDGFYTSHNGTDFYDGYGVEVKPKEKVITVFEA